MHLARLRLDLRNKHVRRDLSNPYDMHRTLTRAFVRDEREAPPRFLWRLEPSDEWGAPTVLVQSTHAADWTKLDAMPGYLKQSVESKTFQLENLLQPDTRYHFRLYANPTVTRVGKRYGLAAEQAQLAWLTRQGERYGFVVEAAFVAASDVLKGFRQNDAPIHLQRVHYEGMLRVVDIESMAKVLPNGIGPGKAFGCGLLSLKRDRREVG
ncbi:MAG: type I-E CRISPR-associated protein Cas6/Cse3/CasE [Azoarcus sp.]|jgi:CRISPR system Cascade subunit CasE|nr:type I-E CRISPR-associated protein Cas6/Cse3/CasE [Azoarcus sp.]